MLPKKVLKGISMFRAAEGFLIKLKVHQPGCPLGSREAKKAATLRSRILYYYKTRAQNTSEGFFATLDMIKALEEDVSSYRDEVEAFNKSCEAEGVAARVIVEDSKRITFNGSADAERSFIMGLEIQEILKKFKSSLQDGKITPDLYKHNVNLPELATGPYKTCLVQAVRALNSAHVKVKTFMENGDSPKIAAKKVADEVKIIGRAIEMFS